MIVLDTHAWIWWIDDPERLPKAARVQIDRAVEKKKVLVSSISAWELAMLVKKDRLQLSIDFRDWIPRCETLPFLTFIPVDNSIVLRSVDLAGYDFPDPADRIIMATALVTQSVLITKNERMRKYKKVRTLWDR